MIEKQIQLEKEAIRGGKEAYIRDLNTKATSGSLHNTAEGTLLIKLGIIPYKDKLEEYFNQDIKAARHKENRLKILSLNSNAGEIAFIVLTTVIKSIMTENNKLTTNAYSVFKALTEVYTLNCMETNDPKLLSFLNDEFKHASKAVKNRLLIEQGEQYVENTLLTKAEGIKVCSILLDILLSSGTNIITRKKVIERGKQHYVLTLTEEAGHILINSTENAIANLLPTLRPSIVPPVDWKGYEEGGYHLLQIPMIKNKEKRQRELYLASDLSYQCKVLNNLQSVAWRINTRVLDVLHDVYTNNMIDPASPRTMPKLYGDLPTSEVYSIDDFFVYPDVETEANGEVTAKSKQAYKNYKKDTEASLIFLDGQKGVRLQWLMMYSMACDMIDYDEFYYVYQFDYRGRVYPYTPLLSPQSNSYGKAMLEFAEGEVLTEEGLYWLKIHIANCYGLDKEPLEDRVQWVDSNIDTILTIADDPIQNVGLWCTADSCYEFIAGCYAYKDYTEGKEVHLPIQLDAVNSGVQMYSGLLRDREGAEATCVVGGVRQDLYQNVADKVNTRLIAGDFTKEVSFTDKDGVSRTESTEYEGNSMAPEYDIVEVPDDYVLKGGEVWCE